MMLAILNTIRYDKFVFMLEYNIKIDSCAKVIQFGNFSFIRIRFSLTLKFEL